MMTKSTRSVAGVIGLGSMGMGAALSLLRSGFEVRGVDLRPEALRRLQEAGGIPASSAGEGAAGADLPLPGPKVR